MAQFTAEERASSRAPPAHRSRHRSQRVAPQSSPRDSSWRGRLRPVGLSRCSRLRAPPPPCSSSSRLASCLSRAWRQRQRTVGSSTTTNSTSSSTSSSSSSSTCSSTSSSTHIGWHQTTQSSCYSDCRREWPSFLSNFEKVNLIFLMDEPGKSTCGAD